MKNKVFALFLTLMVVVIVIVGCQATPETIDAQDQEQDQEQDSTTTETKNESEEQVTINFVNFSANEGGQLTLELVKELFEKENPNIKVNLETFDDDGYVTQLQTRIVGGDAPDCFELSLDGFPLYNSEELLLPLTELIEGSTVDLNVLTEKSVEAFSTNGVNYGLPYSYSTVVLVYNKDLFDAAGIGYPDDSWTWKEVAVAGEKIKALGDNYFGIIQPISTFEFFKVIEQNGGSLLNEDKTEFTINSPENIETLQHMVDNLLVTNISPRADQMGSLDEWGIFKLGKTGMIVTGIWSFPSFTTECDFNWDISVEPGNTTKATHYFANGLCVSKDSPNAEAAYKWIEYLATSERVALARVQLGWELPCATYEASMNEYMQLTPPDNRKAVFDSLEYVVPVPQIIGFNQMKDILDVELSEAASGYKTPQEALDDAQEQISSAVDLQ